MRRVPYDRARKSSCVHQHDYIGPYVADLANVVDMEAIRSVRREDRDRSAWAAPACISGSRSSNVTALAATRRQRRVVDPTFRFMTVDWDGKIRMDCSSPYAMARLIGMRDKFDVAFANDTDADRHGIVTRSERPDEPQSLPRGRHSVSVRQSSRLAQRPRSRQDHRQQWHHRPRHREALAASSSRCPWGSNGSSTA